MYVVRVETTRDDGKVYYAHGRDYELEISTCATLFQNEGGGRMGTLAMWTQILGHPEVTDATVLHLDVVGETPEPTEEEWWKVVR